MSFVLDTNFAITLKEINQLNSLSKLKKVLIPKTVKNEMKDFGEIQGNQQINLEIVDVSDEETKRFVEALSTKLQTTSFHFVIELKEQSSKIPLPSRWKHIANIILRNINQNGAKAFSNVFTNNLDAEIIVEKNENTKVLAHADVHICTFIFNHQKNYVLTMDTCIWSALYIVNPNLKGRIVPIFSCLRLLFKDEPRVFIEALKMTILKKRYRFAKNILDSDASRICYEDLMKSVDDVLQRYVSDLIENANWSAKKENFTELIELRGRIRDLVKNHTHYNGEFSFDDAEFIKELKQIEDSFINLEQQTNN